MDKSQVMGGRLEVGFSVCMYLSSYSTELEPHTQGHIQEEISVFRGIFVEFGSIFYICRL